MRSRHVCKYIVLLIYAGNEGSSDANVTLEFDASVRDCSVIYVSNCDKVGMDCFASILDKLGIEEDCFDKDDGFFGVLLVSSLETLKNDRTDAMRVMVGFLFNSATTSLWLSIVFFSDVGMVLVNSL